MSKSTKHLSLEDEVIKKGTELVNEKVEIKTFSHLVEVLILREHSKMRKEK